MYWSAVGVHGCMCGVSLVRLNAVVLQGTRWTCGADLTLAALLISYRLVTALSWEAQSTHRICLLGALATSPLTAEGKTS